MVKQVLILPNKVLRCENKELWLIIFTPLLMYEHCSLR